MNAAGGSNYQSYSSNKITLPKELEFVNNEDEEVKCRQFKERLIAFQKDLGVENFKVPQIGGKELNLCKLFKAAILRGGFQRVTNNKLWKEIVNQFEIPSSCTSASFTLKSHYIRCLLQYEKKFYEGQGVVNAKGLTADGLPPLRPGVPHIMDQRINQFPGGQQNALMTKNPNQIPRENETNRSQHAQQIMGMSQAGVGLSQQKRHQIMQQSDALYQQNSKALYPLSASIGGPQMAQSQYQLSYLPVSLSNPHRPLTAPLQPAAAIYGKDLVAQQQHFQNNQAMHHSNSAASVNLASTFSEVLPVRCSYTQAESKRLVLAFESRVTSEIVWALNTLIIFSCNTQQSLTLENQPYLLESLSNYLIFCVQNIESLNFSDPNEKKNKLVSVSVPSYIDAQYAYQGPNDQKNGVLTHFDSKLDYRQFGMFTSEIRKRELKHEERMQARAAAQGSNTNQDKDADVAPVKRARGRKTKSKVLEEQNALDELRKKRKKLITVLHQDISELELINHLKSVILIVRNLSFIKPNEHHLIKCFKLIDIVISLFVDLADKEVTQNCLDIISNLGKHIILSEVAFGTELVESLFNLIGLLQIGEVRGIGPQMVDQCIECMRRLSLSAGNERYLETLKDSDIQNLVNLLVSPNIETREGCLEILCTISDRETASALKVRIASQQRCIERLIGLIATGSLTTSEEKISKLAALTLANLNLAPSNRALIAPFEQELALIASSDEKTCKIISEILGDLDSYQVYAK